MSRYLIVLIGCIVTSASSWAAKPFAPVHPDPGLETWRWRSYPELKGLGLQCLAEDQNGNIWFGVNDGVRIYNGLKWTTYTSEHGLEDAPVLRLCSTQDGSMYAGTEIGISRFKDGTWTRVLPLEAGQRWDIADLKEGSDGSLWAGTRWGALHIRGETWTFYTIELFEDWIKTSLPQAQLVVLSNNMAEFQHNPFEGIGTMQHKGFVWEVFPGGPADRAGLRIGDQIVAVDGSREASDTNKPAGTELHLTVKRKGTLFDITLTTKKIEKPWPQFKIHDVFEDQQGKMWFGLYGGDILSYDPALEPSTAWRSYANGYGLHEGVLPRLAQTPDGDLWVVYFGAGRVNRYDGQQWKSLRLRRKGGTDDGTSILVTQEGTLWIGGGRGMLKSFRDGKWHFYQSPSVPTPGTRLFDMLASSDGALWLAFRGQEAVRFDYGENRWSTYEGLHYQCETPDGMLWFVSQDEGIVRHNPNQQTWTRYDKKDGLIESPRRLIMTRTGTLWAIGNHDGVAATARFNGQTWVLQKHPKLSRSIDSRAGVYESENGTLWIGGHRSGRYLGGVLKFTGQAWVHEPPPKVPDIVYSIGQSADGILWFGGNRLSRYNGNVKPTSPVPKELASTQVWIDAMYTSSKRNLWLGTRNYGVFLYDGKDWARYDTRQGLADSRVRDIIQTNDGNIWVSTDRGVSRFDGKTWLTHALHPDLTKNIEKNGLVQTQNGALWITHNRQGTWQTTRLKPDSKPPETEITLFLDEVSQPGNTTLAWTGSDPWRVTPDEEVTFAYRLNGGEWSSFSTKKSDVFQTLPSGEHTFEVKARDQNFNEDPTPAIVLFTVTPPIWQQPWFIALMVILLGSIGFQTRRVIQRDRRLRIANQRVIEEMEKELQVANEMQMSLLPEKPPSVEGIDLSGICMPANHVGGDYYQYIFLDEEKTKLAVVLADVSGHAMQAATVALRFSDILRYEIQGRDNGTEILRGLDNSLQGQIQSNMFVTCGIGVLNLSKKSLTFASAGNPEVYHFRHEKGEVETLGVTGVPLAMTLPVELGVEKTINSIERTLKSGDVVVFASDGIEEACNHTEEFYDQARLMSVIREYGKANSSAEELRDAIVADVHGFLEDAPLEDDVTVIVMRVK